jgi:hypothetical protein
MQSIRVCLIPLKIVVGSKYAPLLLFAPEPFLIAPNLTVMQVDTNVGKNDIGEIKVGDKASFNVIFHCELS